MSDDLETRVASALREAYLSDGERVHLWRKLARAAIAAVKRWEGEWTIPCDVLLPPKTIIKAGCKLDTLLLAMSLPDRPAHFEGKPKVKS